MCPARKTKNMSRIRELAANQLFYIVIIKAGYDGHSV